MTKWTTFLFVTICCCCCHYHPCDAYSMNTPNPHNNELTTTTTKIVWFRDHALRINDNEALYTAIMGDSNSNDDDDSDNYNRMTVPVYLIKSSILYGGSSSASDVFIAQTLKHLNQTCYGKLVVVPYNDNNSDSRTESLEMVNSLAQVAIQIQQQNNNNDDDDIELFYLESFDSILEKNILNDIHTHNQNQEKKRIIHLKPRKYPGSYRLLQYNNNEDNDLMAMNMQKVIEEHPFSSPLIPFCHFVTNELEQQYNDDDDDVRIKTIPPQILQQSLISLYYDSSGSPVINDVIQSVGTNHNTNWGKSILEAWPNASEDDAIHALELYLSSSTTTTTTSESNSDDQNSHDSYREQSLQQQKSQHLQSRLSPYLARGVLSIRQVYETIRRHSSSSSSTTPNISMPVVDEAFLRRVLGWREYTYALTFIFPDVLHGRPIREAYYDIKINNGNNDDDSSLLVDNRKKKEEDDLWLLKQWKLGQTGFPLVDAGMRQLMLEGWMPQVVRLAVSTCLVEGLGIRWEEGMDHFKEYLVDYDAAINTNMWMNTGAVGFDPYYVGMNYKKRKYWDTNGDYVRHWCPELQSLPNYRMVDEHRKIDCLYTPWDAPSDILELANVTLGKTYPHRICDARSNRRQFFSNLRTLRSQWPEEMIDPATGRDLVPIGRGASAKRIPMFTPRALLSKRY